MKTISVDIGNGYIKAVNEEGKTLHFPTVIKENTDKNIIGVSSNNEYRIEIEGINYYIGNLAIAKRGVRQWQSKKSVNADTPLYIALCSHLLTDETTEEINLCLGLPYSYYTELNRGEKLSSELSGKTIETTYQNQKKTITINKVSVYPQGVGAYFSSLYDIQGNPKNGAEVHIKALFVDIGFRTVDVVAFESLNHTFELVQENSFSLEELGIFQAVNQISNQAGEGLELNANDIEFALLNNNSKVESMYGVTDLKDFALSAYKNLSERIVTELNLKLSGQIQRYRYIFLTGGGAARLYPYIKEYYPNISVQDDSIFCNAKGYLALENTR